jgi:hypothetical protein
MRDIVRDTFASWSVGHEGRIPCMYLDVKGWVTCAIGLLVDDCTTLTPPARLFALPWRTPGGALAVASEVRAEWTAVAVLCCEATEGSSRRTGKPPVKAPRGGCAWVGTSRVCLAHRSWLAAQTVTRLRLDAEAIDDVTARTRDGMWAALVRRFPALETAPADAQRAALSLAWAMGPQFSGASWPRLTAALRAGDWATAGEQCKMRESDNPGVRQRNADNKAGFHAAARIVAEGLDPDRFWAGEPSPPASLRAVPPTDADVQDAARATQGVRWWRSRDDDPPPDAA